MRVTKYGQNTAKNIKNRMPREKKSRCNKIESIFSWFQLWVVKRFRMDFFLDFLRGFESMNIQIGFELLKQPQENKRNHNVKNQ